MIRIRQGEAILNNCTKCGEPVPADAAFCENCGNPLTAKHGLLIQAVTAPAGGTGETPGQDAIDLSVIGSLAASASHRGRRHVDNQDSVLIRQLSGGVALAVADGVSTSSRSRDASDTAVRVAIEALEGASTIDGAEMDRAIRLAHRAVCELDYTETPGLAEPQTTIVLTYVQGNRVWFTWVGDSRLYRIHDLDVCVMTEDDSWLNEQLKAGVSLANAMKDPSAHCITQCLGMRDEDPVIHVGTAEIPSGSWLVLCSDGLWNYLESETVLRDLMHKSGVRVDTPPVERATRLVEYANSCGGQDNVTVALYNFTEEQATQMSGNSAV